MKHNSLISRVDTARALREPEAQGSHGETLPLRFNGPAYVPEHDDDRLASQLDRVRALMLDGVWRTLAEIESSTGDPAASISAQLRHLRKPRFGSYKVEKRTRGERRGGLYEYRVTR